MFLPAKAYEPAAAAALAAGLGPSAASVLQDARPPESPGDAGRWLLPDADGADWHAWAALVAGVHAATGLWSAYTLLQGIVLLLLILK